ncbi:hypothetical protein IPJ72_01050 [Candidatus Peregrinibacteria bacterium]|nr:MAG: hypothetical protein IPJ72_01050 [Candidatus Peregrinibacteria bacterium]
MPSCGIQFDGAEYTYGIGITESIGNGFIRTFQLVDTDPSSGQSLTNAFQAIVSVAWSDNLGNHQVDASTIIF